MHDPIHLLLMVKTMDCRSLRLAATCAWLLAAAGCNAISGQATETPYALQVATLEPAAGSRILRIDKVAIGRTTSQVKLSPDSHVIDYVCDGWITLDGEPVSYYFAANGRYQFRCENGRGEVVRLDAGAAP